MSNAGCIKTVVAISAGVAGLLLGGEWVAAAAAVLAAAALEALRIARPL